MNPCVARHEQVAEFYDARREAREKGSFGAAPYKPLSSERLYISEAEWKQLLADRTQPCPLRLRKPGLRQHFIWRQARPQLCRRTHPDRLQASMTP